MILVTSRDTLTAAMSRVGGIINKANTIPILSNVLLSAANGFLQIRSSNADMEAIESIQAEIGQEGEITVSSERLAEIARLLPTGSQIGFKLEGDRLTLTCAKSRFILATLPANQFPQLWTEDWTASLTIDAEILASLISHVDFAQHPGPSDWNMQGVRVEHRDGRLRMIATNRSMIAVCDGPEISEFEAVTLPTKFVAEMARMLPAVGGNVTLGLSDGKASLMGGDITLTSKLVDRSMGYPDYMRVIPKSSDRTARLPVEQSLSGVRRAMVAGQNMGGKGMTVRVTFSDGAVAFTGRNAEADAFDEIAADVTGEEVSLALNPPFLIDALSHAGTEFVDVGFGDRKSATVWRPVDGAEALVAVMPQVF